jgi:hypothetical protein
MAETHFISLENQQPQQPPPPQVWATEADADADAGIRQRRAHYPTFTSLPSLPYDTHQQQQFPLFGTESKPAVPPPQHSYATRLKRYVRRLLAPSENDAYVSHAAAAAAATRWTRIRNAACAALLVLLVFAVLFFVWDVATAPGSDLKRTVSAQLLLRLDDVVVKPSVLLPSGLIVYNVLNPVQPLQRLGDVSAIMHKIRHSAQRRVRDVDVLNIQRRFLPYRYVSSSDLDADPVAVNATLDELKAIIRSTQPPEGLLCEALIHYGIERNVVYVYRWTSEPAAAAAEASAEEDSFLYNVYVSERSAETVLQSARIKLQEQCRIASIIAREAGTESNVPAPAAAKVSAWATIEYTNDAGNKQRRRIHQPLLACIDHVLKLSGYPTTETIKKD